MFFLFQASHEANPSMFRLLVAVFFAPKPNFWGKWFEEHQFQLGLGKNHGDFMDHHVKYIK